MTDRVIQQVDRFARDCRHNKFIYDETLGYVECGICGEHLNPMWVIEQFTNKESRVVRYLEQLNRLVDETRAKTKCKCQHCGQMTDIANEREVSKAFNGRN
ncbi:hypothetical protein [Aeromonas salmonicida]|uniref:hypothetical protein n=1 Tax=Aeromonas salmonicida TaxID=645 RepID=UPI00232AD14D|nr:hypothetical protein [Aeromonas salmonicida]WCH25215.1 hypothetical protein ONZ54_22845 [Aeromonas salmonicida]